MHPYLHPFGLTIPTFGVCMAIGMVAAFVLLFFLRKKQTLLSDDDILSAAIWAIISGLLGAKILYWIVEFDQIIADPHYLIETLTAGFVFYGALIGGVIGILLYVRRAKKNIFSILDLFSPSFAFAQAFGRIGCFNAGCCYGMQCESPISVVFPTGGSAPAGVPLLPTQLMESAFLFLLTAALVWIYCKKKPHGTVTGWYFILYGVWRFIIEFFRSDDRGAVGGLSTSQFIGIFIVIAGAVLLLLIKKGVVSRETIADASAAAEPPSEKDEAETSDQPSDDAQK